MPTFKGWRPEPGTLRRAARTGTSSLRRAVQTGRVQAEQLLDPARRPLVLGRVEVDSLEPLPDGTEAGLSLGARLHTGECVALKGDDPDPHVPHAGDRGRPWREWLFAQTPRRFGQEGLVPPVVIRRHQGEWVSAQAWAEGTRGDDFLPLSLPEGARDVHVDAVELVTSEGGPEKLAQLLWVRNDDDGKAKQWVARNLGTLDWRNIHASAVLHYLTGNIGNHPRNWAAVKSEDGLVGMASFDGAKTFVPELPDGYFLSDNAARLSLLAAEVGGPSRFDPSLVHALSSFDVRGWKRDMAAAGVPESEQAAALERLERLQTHGLAALFQFPLEGMDPGRIERGRAAIPSTAGATGTDAVEWAADAFYSHRPDLYAAYASGFLRSLYPNPTHEGLGDLALLERVVELAPGKVGLDAGCGPSGRHASWLGEEHGCTVYGVDAVKENIRYLQATKPELAPRVAQQDLSEPFALPADFPERFDFATCMYVIQHIDRDKLRAALENVTSRLNEGGVLLLGYKEGEGLHRSVDRLLGVERSFLLHRHDELLSTLGELGMELVPEEDGKIGGVMGFHNDVVDVPSTLLILRKRGAMAGSPE